MPFIADLHIHSRFSRATSRDLDLPHLYAAAQHKGVAVVGTGDLTHPKWTQELKDQLVDAGGGLYRLRDDVARAAEMEVPAACRGPVRFMLTGEVSTIYKRAGRVRKVHHVICAPDFASAGRFADSLAALGNVASDGRPILGLDSRDLLEIALGSGPDMALIPAHIWTPWFSALGSNSGFDSIQDCYGPLTGHVFAVETGLSSDPPMNWRLSDLDRFVLVSNSDAHSPGKLGREANVFDTGMSYHEIMDALRSGDRKRFLGTVEFFPEEGKYHLDGHRKCGTRLTPRETREAGGSCPVCGKPVTVGVMHRVEELADRSEGEVPERRGAYWSLIPLDEVLGEVLCQGAGTEGVARLRGRLLAALGPELSLLREVPLEDLGRHGSARLSEAIRRMRNGEVRRSAGFDGEYGTIRLFDEGEQAGGGQTQIAIPGLSACAPEEKAEQSQAQGHRGQTPRSPAEGSMLDLWYATGDASACRVAPPDDPDRARPEALHADDLLAGLNPEQQRAAKSAGPLLVVAGPGTGKTRALTHRLAYQIKATGLNPERCLAVTFTNRAAGEMRERLTRLLGRAADSIWVCTFHALGLRILVEQTGATPVVINEPEQIELMRRAVRKLGENLGERDLRAALGRISWAAQRLHAGEEPAAAPLALAYQGEKERAGVIDLDDLIVLPVELLRRDPECLARWRGRFDSISVDEFQDLNAVQYDLVRMLLDREGKGLCAIGDPDQAIYGFRGADVRWFSRLEQDYPGVELIRLVQNYRSTPEILGASAGVISRNQSRARVSLRAQIPGGPRLLIADSATEKAEAEFVAHAVERWMGGVSYFSLDTGRAEGEQRSLSFGDFAVLFRLGAQVDPLREALERLGLPLQVAGCDPVWRRSEVRDVLAYLRLAARPDDDAAALRALCAPRRVGPAFIERLRHAAADAGRPVMDVLPAIAAGGSAAHKNAVRQFIETVGRLRVDSARLDAAGLIEQVIELSGLGAAVPAGPEGTRVKEHWRALVRLARRGGGRIEEFLGWLAVARPADEHDSRAERVSLLTMHAAKGLEFPVVFITGCEEGLVPYLKEEDGQERVAEERRLFYVGMTRAQHALVLTRARSRSLFGRRLRPKPSPFLCDIEQDLREQVQASGPKRKKRPSQMSLF